MMVKVERSGRVRAFPSDVMMMGLAARPPTAQREVLCGLEDDDLLRMVHTLPREADLVPEISGHRLMVSIRLMKADGEGRLRPYTEDCAFELALCA